MCIFEFYLTALERAFSDSVTLGQAIVFVLVAVMGLFQNRLKDSASTHARITSGRVALILLIGLICARFPFAVYGLWKDENAGRLRAECLLAQSHDAREQRKAVIEKNLQGFYARAQELLHRRITPDQFPTWASEEGHLAQEMINWVKSNMGVPAAARLQDMNGPAYDFSGMSSINATYVQALNWLNKVSANLGVLQEQPEWDSFKPSAPPKCPP
jgi:hypothetical protein